MNQVDSFADVILPLALGRRYTYAIPEEFMESLSVGKRVVVQFGKKKIYTAIVVKIHQVKPPYETKSLISVLDERPIVNEKQLELWDWIASYYLCTPGDVMSAALPSGLKLESETRIMLANSVNSDSDLTILGDREHQVIDALRLKNGLTLDEMAKVIKRKNIFPFIRTLIDKGLVTVDEELKSKFKSKKDVYVKLSEKANDEEWMKGIFKQLEKRAPKQLEFLMIFLKLSMDERDNNKEVLKSSLLAITESSVAALTQLIKKGVLEELEKETERLKPYLGRLDAKISFSDFQQKAIDEINTNLKSNDVVLLHGVTSSGKTEIYIRLIEDALAQAKQVLYLLPEIALTSQIIRRLQKHFGNSVGVYHSRFSDNERVEVWNNVLLQKHSQKTNYKIILGARSALFLPFNNLGLVIVDEEHENSFKQQDPAPRYNARDTAIFLAQLHQAKTILGSATPSLESYHNAKQGKYGLVQVTERFGGILMPEISVVDIKDETRKKKMKSHFSSVMIDHIQLALDKKEQVILFQNRRGYAPYLECTACNWNPCCIHCDVTLVYHKLSNQLRCHYCGFHQDPPNMCAECGETAIKMLGFGTEKIEDELTIFFPDARVARLDIDTARTRHSFSQLISDFEKRKIDILVGTQMVTKGLDFDDVSTVGIMNADSMLKYPDFRAHERSFQLMAQVSGRSGRKNKRGKVIIQSYAPDHSVIQHVIQNDYKSFFDDELKERNKFAYPPFCRLIEITLKHRDIRVLSDVSDKFAVILRKTLHAQVLGPEMPAVGRIRSLYLKTILLKIEKNHSLLDTKIKLKQVLDDFRMKEENRSLIVQFDVDPM